MTIEEILSLGSSDEIIEALKDKEIEVPSWTGDNGLEKEYDPSKHEVMNECLYPSKRSDLDNSLKIILDCLQRTKTIKNDNLCCKIVARKFIDKENPRIIIKIETI